MSDHNHEHNNSGHHNAEHKEHEKVPTAPLSIDREYKFSFKKQTIKDELGAEIKRPAITLRAPIPTFDGFINSLTNDPKVGPFVLDLIEEAIKDQIKIQLSDEEKPVNRQEDLDLSKLTLEAIANLPKSERGGSAITKESLEAFEADYILVMTPIRVAADPKNGAAKAANAAALFKGKLAKVRSEKNALKFLRDQLTIWAANTANLEDHQDVFEYLDNKCTTYLNADNVSHLESL